MPARARHRSVPDIWPGFVDAISAMLIIVIFLLMVFTLAQSFLSDMLSGRNEALDRLNRQVTELADMLSLERQSNTVLRDDLAQLSSELQSSIATRDVLTTQLATLTDERDDLANTLALRIQEKNRLLANLKDEASRAEAEKLRADTVDKELEDAFKTISADREKIRVQLTTLESLKRDITVLQKVKGELETRVTTLATSLDKNKKSLTAARDRTKALVASLSTAKERTALAQKKIEEQDVKLAKLQLDTEISSKLLTEEQKSSAQARARVALLNRQLAALRQQLSRISVALEASETKAKEQDTRIVNLGSRLNAALASKVEELARYRSEFFGRLRELLGDRNDVRVEGDRFVFQSEVLFGSGSADMVGAGRDQISRLATTLKDIASRIPNDIDWVLRVDGHTDRIPIHTAQFPSNWELSTARALAVVKLLIEDGLPPHRLAAAGFGEYRPLDKTSSLESLRRNRRIEFKLTGR